MTAWSGFFYAILAGVNARAHRHTDGALHALVLNLFKAEEFRRWLRFGLTPTSSPRSQARRPRTSPSSTRRSGPSRPPRSKSLCTASRPSCLRRPGPFPRGTRDPAEVGAACPAARRRGGPRGQISIHEPMRRRWPTAARDPRPPGGPPAHSRSTRRAAAPSKITLRGSRSPWERARTGQRCSASIASAASARLMRPRSAPRARPAEHQRGPSHGSSSRRARISARVRSSCGTPAYVPSVVRRPSGPPAIAWTCHAPDAA